MMFKSRIMGAFLFSLMVKTLKKHNCSKETEKTFFDYLFFAIFAF